MKMNFAIPIIGLDGAPIMDVRGAKDKEGNPLEALLLSKTLGNIVGNRQKSKDPMYERALAMRIYQSEGPVDINTKDLKILDTCLKEAGLATITEGQAREIMENPLPSEGVDCAPSQEKS